MAYVLDNFGLGNNKMALILKGIFGTKQKCSFEEILKTLGL